MKIVIDISKDRYDEIMSMDWKNCRRFFDEEIRAIHDGKALEQEPCDEEYIKVPKKALKYRTAGMVAYNAEWLKNHFNIERTAICGEQEPCDAVSKEAVLNGIFDDEYIKDHINGDVWERIEGIVDALPSVTPAEKVGHWMHDGSHWKNRWICSECGYKLIDEQTRYCPNCGAKMEQYGSSSGTENP